MKTTAAIGALAALALFVGTARADWEVTGKVTCWDSDAEALDKDKAGSDQLVALCLGVDESDPSVADSALVFGVDPRELRVVRRCDSQILCVVSAELGCSVAGPTNDNGFKRKGTCVHHLKDVGLHHVDGSLFCSEGDRYTIEPNRYTYKATCEGEFAIDGRPCTVQLKTGREFEQAAACAP